MPGMRERGRAVVSIKWRGGAGEPASSAGPRQAIEAPDRSAYVNRLYTVVEDNAEAAAS